VLAAAAAAAAAHQQQTTSGSSETQQHNDLQRATLPINTHEPARVLHCRLTVL